MNRRDYLKQMGLATAVTIGSNHLAGLRAFAGTSSEVNSDSSNSYDAIPPQTILGDWPTGTKPDPANFTVKLIFSGMCIFGYNGKEANVAFHRGDKTKHKMAIMAFEKGTPCTNIYTVADGTQQASIGTIEVGIEGKSNDVNFFLGNDFCRAGDIGDELDFRWLIDLEGPDGFKKELKPKNHDKFSTKLFVRHGTFYTYQRTNATFKAMGGKLDGKYFGHVAKVMAANIGPLNNGESVYLRVDGRPVVPNMTKGTTGTQYEIYFLNDRQTGDDTDFDMVFDELGSFTDKFTLVRVGPPKEEKTKDLCQNLPLVTRATDEAPCMGAGFGSGNGLG